MIMVIQTSFFKHVSHIKLFFRLNCYANKFYKNILSNQNRVVFKLLIFFLKICLEIMGANNYLKLRST